MWMSGTKLDNFINHNAKYCSSLVNTDIANVEFIARFRSVPMKVGLRETLQ